MGRFIIAFGALLAADLGLKAWSFAAMDLFDPPRMLVPGVLALKLTLNEGAIFGILQGQKVIFVIASLAAVGIIGFFFAQSRADERMMHMSLALILAGAMGNLYDRIVHGAVRDMLYLFPGVELPFGWQWPGGSEYLYPWIFNLADVYLLIGIGLILLSSLLYHPRPSDTAAKA